MGRPDLESTAPVHKKPRILLVRLSAIGDVINTLPALGALRHRFAGAYLAWLVEDKARSVLEGHPFLDDLFVFERAQVVRDLKTPGRIMEGAREIARLGRNLRAAKFDLLLDFHGNLKSGLLGSLACATTRVGYDRKNSREGNFLFNRHHVRLADSRIHRVEKHLALLEAVGIRTRRFPYLLSIPQQARAFARAFLQEAIPGRPYAVLHPGTSASGAHKRWPAPFFGRLAERLVREASLEILVTSGPGELELAREVASACRETLHLPQTRSLLQLAALVERARVFVSADTGPMHLASALGVPVVALFGPKDPVVYGPFGTRNRVISAPLPCAPCGRRRCDDSRCMQSISPDQVFDAVLDLLEEARNAWADRPLEGDP